MAYIPDSGSVVAFQSDPTKLVGTVSVVGTIGVTGNPSISGQVGASVVGHAPVVIVGGSIATSFTPPANQSVSGEVSISNFPTTQNVSGSVVAFQGTSPWAVAPNNSSIIAIPQGSVGAVIIGGSILTTTGNSSVQVLNFPANQSVSGAVSISNFPTTQNVSGSVAAWLQSSNASVITVGTAAPNQSVSGTVQTDVRGSVATVIIGGSIAASFTPPANQSVSGTVDVGNFPTTQNVSGSVVAFQGTSEWTVKSSLAGGIFPVSGSVAAVVTNFPATQVVNFQNSSVIAFQLAGSVLATSATVNPAANQSVSGTVGASVIGHAPVVIVGGSIAASFTPPANQSVSGEVSISNFPTTQNVSGSVVAFQGGAPWANTNVGSVITVGQGSVAVAIISGSIAASFTPPANQSVSGTVDAAQIGAWRVSVVSSNPSSMLVGASIIGLTPVNIVGTPTVNTAGSVVAFQGTSPWIITGSVQGGGVQYAEDDVAPSVTGTAVMFRKSQDSSIMEVVNPLAPLPVNVLGNPSVSGTVLIGNTNVNVSGSVVAFGFPTTQNVSGSVAAWLQSSNASVITVGTAAANQSVSGTVDIGNFPANQSVSGAVSVSNFPTTQNVSGSVISFLTSTNASVITVGTAAANQSVSGTVNTLPIGTIVTSLVSTVPSSVIVGSSIFGQLPAGTAMLGSVVAYQGAIPWTIGSVYGNISGSVAATITNTNVNVSGSVVAFGFPTNQNVSGSVVAFQGTNPWVVGSVVTTTPGTPFRYFGSLVSASVTLIAASVSGQRHHVTDFKFFNTGSVAQLITFQDGSTSILGFTGAPAGGGSNYAGAKVPDRTAPSQDLAYKITGTSSVVYATVSGYTL